MSIPDCQTAEVSQFNGIWLPSPGQIDDTKITLDHGRSGKNAQYFADSVMKRYGHSSVFSPGNIVTSMINWLFEFGTPAMQHNALAWFASGVGVRYTDLGTISPALAIAQTTAASAFMMVYGSRLYAAFIDSNGNGMAPGQVYGFGVGAEPLFAPPITTVPTFSELGATGTTKGAKLFGYLIQTKNGFITRPSPAPSDIFSGVSYTSLGGLIEMSIPVPGGGWPSYALNIAAIMTTTANPGQFFIVPGVGLAPPWYVVQQSGPTTAFISITDSSLTSYGTDATPYLTQLTQTVTGTAPINPSMIFPYGQRVGYVTQDSAGIHVCYISDSSQPQTINAANNAVYLPGQLPITLAFALRGVLYIMGPHWTYSTSDSGGVPATWAEPQIVDGGIGALGQWAVTINTSQNYAWVADESGLYLFTGGRFPDLSISYYQKSDWMRINFAAPNAIQVVDDKTNNRVHVMCPLDGATVATHILSWDYSLGQTPEQVKYSGPCDISSYSLGAMALVQNNSTKHLEKWIAPHNSSQSVGRENNGQEAHPFRDFSSSIDFSYETALMPSGMAGRLCMYHGSRMRVRGNGTMTVTANGLDGTPVAGPFTVPSQFTIPKSSTLTTRPGAEILQRFYAMSEYLSVLFECGGLDDWAQISKSDTLYTPAFPQR